MAPPKTHPHSSGTYAPQSDLEASYFPNTATPLVPTGETLVASREDIPPPVTPTTEQPPAPPGAPNPPPSQARSVPFPSLRSQPSAIRLRRLRPPSSSGSRLTPVATNPQPSRPRRQDGDDAVTARRRSSSEPLSPGALANARVVNMDPMPVVPEGQTPPLYVAEGPQQDKPEVVVPRRFMMRRRRAHSKVYAQPGVASDDCYDSKVVDFLDVIDPEVATLSSITNVQNSLFVPNLPTIFGRSLNRRPTYDLSRLPFIPGAFPPSTEDVASTKDLGDETTPSDGGQPPVRRTHSFSTVLTSTPQYAILPEGHSLEGWDEEDIKLLNDHVRHLLHSRRSKVKQRFKAFGKYASRPLGFLITLYATLITLFGLAWVLFLIGWIYVGEEQLYAIEVIDQVLVALFAVVGDGMIPWRLRDTWYMANIARFHHKTVKLRKNLLLPKLKNKNDLPTDPSHVPDVEAQPQPQKQDDFFPVLTDEQQARLVHYQTKFAKSHTFYKPHETSTHYAFPYKLMVTIVLLLDLHSCLQLSLGLLTWTIPYSRRPAAATTTVLCCSIFVNALAGVLITVGDRRTRKKDVIERLMIQELTGEVIHKMEKEKKKEEEKEKDKEEGKGSGGVLEPLKNLGGAMGRRSSSEEGSRRRSLDALADGFKKKSTDGGRRSAEMERGRRDENAGGGASHRKDRSKVGSFDAGVSGLGRVAEADHEPDHHGDEGAGMKIPGAFV